MVYTIRKKVGLYRRAWHIFLARAFKKEITVYRQDLNCRMEPCFLCHRCEEYISWDCGADDENFTLCDDCADVERGLGLRYPKTDVDWNKE